MDNQRDWSPRRISRSGHRLRKDRRVVGHVPYPPHPRMTYTRLTYLPSLPFSLSPSLPFPLSLTSLLPSLLRLSSPPTHTLYLPPSASVYPCRWWVDYLSLSGTSRPSPTPPGTTRGTTTGRKGPLDERRGPGTGRRGERDVLHRTPWTSREGTRTDTPGPDRRGTTRTSYGTPGRHPGPSDRTFGGGTSESMT